MPLTLREIAEQVREKAVENLTTMYHFPSDLGGACGICSFALKESIKKHYSDAKPIVKSGYFNAPVRERDHCWLEVDGLIIDITATQFGNYEPIIITDINSKFYCDGTDIPHYKRLSFWMEPYRPTLEKIQECVI